jgi:hypothetical protein
MQRLRKDDKVNKGIEAAGEVRQEQLISARPSADLPQSLGNRNVARLLQPRDRRSPSTIQRKPLEVSHPADSDEKEADDVARKVFDGQTTQVHGTGVTVNRSGDGPTELTPHFQSKLENSKGRGQPLDDSTRSEMESKMGADFAGVSIHTDVNAVDLNRQVRAKAFTHGKDIYFRDGNPDPSTGHGKHLLAHELAHTIQQSRTSFGKHGPAASVGAQTIMRSPGPFAEATKRGDTRTLYIRGESRVNKIKATLAKADVLFEGSPTKANIVKKKPKGGSMAEFYLGKVSTTSATTDAVKKVLAKIIPAGSEVFVTTDEFVEKLSTVLAAFRKGHPHTSSNLQVLSIINQPAVDVPGHDKSCIETMNQCIQNIYGTGTLKKQNLSDTAFGSIEKLQKKKLAGTSEKVSLDYVGKGRFQILMANIEKVTKFSPKSLAQTLIDMTKDKEDGFYVIVCSLLKGYHSILIIVKKQKDKFRFEWKDQDKAVEFSVDQLHHEFFGYASGRYSWRIRKRYQKEYGGALADKYQDLKDDDKLKKVEELEKINVIDDLKQTIIAPLNP